MIRPASRLASCGLAFSVVGYAALAGCASPDSASQEQVSHSAVEGPAVAATPPPHVIGTESRPVTPAATVTSVQIPRLGVSAHLVPLRLDHRTLRGPDQPEDVGWYADSPLPGDRGAAVLVGHVDSRTGPAVFYRLADLRPGDLVVIRRTDGRLRFRVQDVTRYRRSNVPAQAVYGPTPDRALRLITCDGPYRHGSGYRDNVVVYALGE